MTEQKQTQSERVKLVAGTYSVESYEVAFSGKYGKYLTCTVVGKDGKATEAYTFQRNVVEPLDSLQEDIENMRGGQPFTMILEGKQTTITDRTTQQPKEITVLRVHRLIFLGRMVQRINRAWTNGRITHSLVVAKRDTEALANAKPLQPTKAEAKAKKEAKANADSRAKTETPTPAPAPSAPTAQAGK